ncbi:MAG: hypothetical protein KA184_10205 [Candidatus Hydrogenedentes bacterium]|nr:hypothetical protein [Candidatus Hydrogenedentota bacterium]
MPLYTEKQTFAPWVYAVLVIGELGALAALALVLAQTGDATLQIVVLGTWALGGVMVANLLGLGTEVTRDAVTVRFGLLFTCYRKRFALTDIRAARAVEYRPLRDAGGWGIRFGRFEGRPCRFLNARGNRGVFLETAQKPCIIGSQQPEALCSAILQASGRGG